jgi:hypothetical protein
MKKAMILIILLSLIAVVLNAQDFTLLSNEPSSGDGVKAFWDFFTWIEVGALCTAAGLALGLAFTYDNQGDRLPSLIIGGSIGLGSALTISLLSSSGDSTGEVIGGHIIPVLLGVPLGIIAIPVAFLVLCYGVVVGVVR